MSKSAIKYITRNIKAPIGAAWLIDIIKDKNVRKNWRNADVLARFLISTVANAYEGENSTTFVKNGFKDMDHAIESYVESNLAEWNQDKFLKSSFGKADGDSVEARLKDAKRRYNAFETKQALCDQLISENQ